MNSETSLRVAANTFTRFNSDWTAVHRAGKFNADGILVIGGKNEEPKPRPAPRKTRAKT